MCVKPKGFRGDVKTPNVFHERKDLKIMTDGPTKDRQTQRLMDGQKDGKLIY